MNRRNAVLALLALGAAGMTVPVVAQQAARIPRIAFPAIAPRHAIEDLIAAFEEGLREHGLVNGKNVAIEYAFADGKLERLPEMMQEAVRRNVDIIVTGVDLQTSAAKAATQTIPIVMTLSKDPIEQGFAATYARPGGNITGLAWEIGPGPNVKRLEFLKEAAPRISRVAVLFDPPYDENYGAGPQIRTAAAHLGLSLSWWDIGDDFERAFALALRERTDALYWNGGARQRARRTEVVSLSARSRLPACYLDPAFVDAGGLMSYSPNVHDLFRRTGTYVDKIIKGARPGELPIEQATKFEFVINLRAARSLGLAVPQSLLLRADRVIE